MIRVQKEDFDLTAEYHKLIKKGESGAIVTFVGLVRDFNKGRVNESMLLQHYPGMTEKVLKKIEQEARQRWRLLETTIIHRVGELLSGDQIVLVGVSSKHRSDAFSAAQFIMDILKSEAPFWKKEGEHWVEAKSSDDKAAARWL
ncbi:molybdopterin synthase subunit MoaE [Alteromonadaceae bacterium Bs31]|nr:molybdopterin synthase subunit MoaE [Alteromonadaceae bacterium Bs31]